MKLEMTVKQPITLCDSYGLQCTIGVGSKVVLTGVTQSQVTFEVNNRYSLTIGINEHLHTFTNKNVELISKRLDVGTKVVIVNPNHVYFGDVIELTGANMYLPQVRLMYKHGLYSNSEIFNYSDIEFYDESTKYEGMIVFYDENDTVEKVAGRTFKRGGVEYVEVTGDNNARYTNLYVGTLWCYKDDKSEELVPLDSIGAN